MTIQAFIFDLDGIITDTAEYHYLAWKALGDNLGIPLDREFNELLKGVDRMTSLERILKLGSRENDFSEPEKIELASRKNTHYVELIKRVSPQDILPGIKTLLEDISAAGLKIALASASRNAPAIVKSLSLEKYFKIIVDPTTLKRSKPDPEIFVRAAEMLNVERAQCVGIEDAAAGIDSIKSAGIFAVGVGDQNALTKADLLLTETSKLKLSTIQAAFAQFQNRLA